MRLGQPVHKGQRVTPGPRDRRAHKVMSERPDHRDRRGRKAPRVILARQEQTEQREPKAHRDRRAFVV